MLYREGTLLDNRMDKTNPRQTWKIHLAVFAVITGSAALSCRNVARWQDAYAALFEKSRRTVPPSSWCPLLHLGINCFLVCEYVVADSVVPVLMAMIWRHAEETTFTNNMGCWCCIQLVDGRQVTLTCKVFVTTFDVNNSPVWLGCENVLQSSQSNQ